MASLSPTEEVEYATTDDVATLTKLVTKNHDETKDVKRSVQALRRRMDKRFDDVDKRFDDVDKRFDDVDKRFDDVDKRFDDVDKHFDELERKIDAKFEQVGKRIGALFDLIMRDRK